MHSWTRQAVVQLILSAVIAAFPAYAVVQGEKGTGVTIKTVSKDDISGELLSFSSAEGAVLRTAAGEMAVPLQDLVRLTVATPVPRRAERECTLTLTNGDLLSGKFAESRPDAVVFETAEVGRVLIELESIAGIDAPAAFQPAYKASADWFGRAGKTDEDRILLTNGDTVSGFITSIDGEGLTLQSTLGDTSVSLRRLVAVRMASPRPPALHGLFLVITFAAGGRLTVTDLEWSREAAEARLSAGQSVRIEPERIAQVEVLGGRWEWLSRHTPASDEHTPMLGLSFPHAADRNVLGGPIVVRGERFAHGVGVHSRSNLTYELKGAYSEFVTFFGIDDDSGSFADVSVVILVDGQHRFEVPHVLPGVLHGPIRLDIARASRIELMVGFGENGDIQDRFDWVEPALIREP